MAWRRLRRLCFQRRSSRGGRADLNLPFFKVVFLQVDEGRPCVAAFRKQVELIGQPVAEDVPARLPADALFDQAGGNTQTVPPSSRRFAKQTARLPIETVLVMSKTRTGKPRAAKSGAAVRSTRPAPIPRTGQRILVPCSWARSDKGRRASFRSCAS